MLTGMELMACPNQAVPAEVMHHIVHVESGYNPYAIGVVGGQLVRQPQNLDEALATVQMLESKGYNFSVGVAQVNRSNLAKYGLTTYQQAFDPCQNLAVGSRILNECYYSSGSDWGKAFSCYYSGNFVTGFRDGYVQKVFDSINQSVPLAGANVATAIPLQTTPVGHNVTRTTLATGTIVLPPQDSAAYRQAIRSSLIDAAANTLVSKVASVITKPDTSTPDASSAITSDPALIAETAAAAAVTTASNTHPAQLPIQSAQATSANADVFIPKVTRLGEVAAPDTSEHATVTTAQTAAPQTAIQVGTPKPVGDPADLRRGGDDNAFVF